MGWGRWAVRLAAGLVVGGVLAETGATADPRQLLGTISAQGDVRVRDDEIGRRDEGQSVPRSGAPLLEGALVMVGPKSAALLNLSSDGMIGLRAGGAIQAGTRDLDGLRVTLWVGEALVRIPTTSRMTLATATGTIRSDPLMPAAAGPITSAEASVKLLPDGQTIVRVETGSLRIEGADGGPTVVRAGEQATLLPDAAPRLVAAAAPLPGESVTGAVTPAVATGKAASAGIFAIDSDLAILAGLGGAVVAGGTLGGLAASGQFSSDHHDAAPAGSTPGSVQGSAQGSAFRAPR